MIKRKAQIFKPEGEGDWRLETGEIERSFCNLRNSAINMPARAYLPHDPRLPGFSPTRGKEDISPTPNDEVSAPHQKRDRGHISPIHFS